MIPAFGFEAYYATAEVIDTLLLRDDADLNLIIADWPDEIDLTWIITSEIEPGENGGVHELAGLVHPSLLQADRLIVSIEYRVTDDPHLLEFGFSGAPVWSQQNSMAHPDGNGWRVIKRGLVRSDDEEPFGGVADQFLLRMQYVEVRSLRIEDGGPLGDLNFDERIDTRDSTIVLLHFGETGDLSPEQGDANGDGTVDAIDLNEVLLGME